jgi:hypothetical protein
MRLLAVSIGRYGGGSVRSMSSVFPGNLLAGRFVREVGPRPGADGSRIADRVQPGRPAVIGSRAAGSETAD